MRNAHITEMRGKLGINWALYTRARRKVKARNQGEKDLNSCLSFFEEGLEMLVTSLDRISCGDQRTEANTEGIQLHRLADRIESLAALDRDVFTAEVDKLKSISKESFAWAKSSFKAARDDGTRAFYSKALGVGERLIVAKVRYEDKIVSLVCLMTSPDTPLSVKIGNFR
jgi:hypothetical protein